MGRVLQLPAGSTTLAELRAQGGDPDPFNVRYWGVGNETWGCGGNLTPEEYATEYRRYTAWVPGYGGSSRSSDRGRTAATWPGRAASSPTLTEKGDGALGSMWGWALHHYSWNVSRGATTDWDAGKGDALRFYTTEECYELLSARQPHGVADHRALDRASARSTRRHRVKLVVDEWGTWLKPGSEVHPAHLLGQQSTMRDALARGHHARHRSTGTPTRS